MHLNRQLFTHLKPALLKWFELSEIYRASYTVDVT